MTTRRTERATEAADGSACRRSGGGWALLLLLVLAAGCHRGGRAPAAPPPPPRAAPPPASPVVPAATPLDVAEAALAAGDFAAAASAFEDYLVSAPDGAAADRALFQLGLLYGLQQGGGGGPATGRARLRTLVERFADSPYALPARSLLNLMEEIDRLRGEVRRQRQLADQLKKDLEALKRIDLGGQQPR